MPSKLLLCLQFGAIATACSIGGGPFFVPLFTYDLGFSECPLSTPKADG